MESIKKRRVIPARCLLEVAAMIEQRFETYGDISEDYELGFYESDNKIVVILISRYPKKNIEAIWTWEE